MTYCIDCCRKLGVPIEDLRIKTAVCALCGYECLTLNYEDSLPPRT